MNLHLQNQTAVIIGAARGLGAAIAREFAGEGANLALFDREKALEPAAEQWAAECGVRVVSCLGDVTSYESVKAAAAQFIRELGRIDHLVFAVGIGSGKFGFPFWELEPSDWPRVLETNLMGAVHALHAFTPFFLEAKAGSMLLSPRSPGKSVPRPIRPTARPKPRSSISCNAPPKIWRSTASASMPSVRAW